MARKKKTEQTEGKVEAVEEKKDVAEATEEFPDIDIGIDIFSPQAPIEGGKEEVKKKITKKELEEKAKKLAEKLGEVTSEELKEKLEASRKTLVPVNDYVDSGIYIGTKVITPHMRPFVYRRRNDGIAIINKNLIDKQLRELIKKLIKYDPENFIVVCKREAGWKAVEKFSQLTGVRIFTKKYPAGILTNPRLPNFFETDMVFICDPWIDKNALNDAKIVKKKVFGICDTNNYTFGVDEFVPGNNKHSKSIGLIFYILAREYLKEKKIDKEVKMSDFVEDDSQQA
ncbi:MAG: 30S ribosomal protein S2 [Candidatus Pacearchaeota archaeon]|nr:30S ribosomal protein S2 [Candidatus Pacearchaeota archaeon]